MLLTPAGCCCHMLLIAAAPAMQAAIANEKRTLERFAHCVVRKGIILARDYGAEATKVETEHLETLEHNLVEEWAEECCKGHAAQMLAKRFSELLHQSLIIGFHLQE